VNVFNRPYFIFIYLFYWKNPSFSLEKITENFESLNYGDGYKKYEWKMEGAFFVLFLKHRGS